jgi:aminoglycoside phosphotransferase family enzyme/predicted kinase
MAPLPTRSDSLIAALSSPEIYQGGAQSVEVRETHISWIFLVGDRAYKLKKPVVLPFLDYGTPERRRTMCNEEVRLNRRLASDLYLGVRCVAAAAEGIRLAPQDDPRALDYLVEMRRYDERSTLAAKLDRATEQQLRSEIESLAQLLVRFHEGARTVADGGTLAVRRRVDRNLQELQALLGSSADLNRLTALARFTYAFLAARAGLVVEGHGDLRAEHVLLDGTIRVVDCIEFEPRMRELDVADELAFLVMDLTWRGGDRVASRLLHAYRDAGGDPGEDDLVAFYACFRALVRAKVALVRAGQPPPTGTAEHDARTARDLVALAERYAWRARLPLVIVICGLPAVGKSTLARALSSMSGLPCLSSDIVRKQAAGIAPTERAPLSAYSAQANRRAYAELGRLAADAATTQRGALVDATFRHRADRSAFLAAFGGAAPLHFIECQAPLEMAAERARRREAENRSSDASEDVVRRERESWEPLDEVKPEAHTTLRSDRPLEGQLADLQDALDHRLGCVPDGSIAV